MLPTYHFIFFLAYNSSLKSFYLPLQFLHKNVSKFTIHNLYIHLHSNSQNWSSNFLFFTTNYSFQRHFECEKLTQAVMKEQSNSTIPFCKGYSSKNFTERVEHHLFFSIDWEVINIKIFLKYYYIYF